MARPVEAAGGGIVVAGAEVLLVDRRVPLLAGVEEGGGGGFGVKAEGVAVGVVAVGLGDVQAAVYQEPGGTVGIGEEVSRSVTAWSIRARVAPWASDRR